MAALSPFAFWTGDGRELLKDFEREWTDTFPDFRIYGEEDVLPLIRHYAPEHVSVFDAIRFPAGKSDVARYIFLYERGGLYVDCHIGLVRAEGVRSLLASLGALDGVFVDRRLSGFVPRLPGEHFVISGMVFGRAGCGLFLEIFRKALADLAALQVYEREHGRANLTTWEVCGPLMLNKILGGGAAPYRDVRADLVDRIAIIEEETAPMVRDRFRAQSLPGQHWSERAKRERLFEG